MNLLKISNKLISLKMLAIFIFIFMITLITVLRNTATIDSSSKTMKTNQKTLLAFLNTDFRGPLGSKNTLPASDNYLSNYSRYHSYKYSSPIRKSYITKPVNEIWQGSYTVELPLALLAYLSNVQTALGIKGSIGEIGVHGGLFFIGLAHLAAEQESLWACDVFQHQEKNVDGSGNGNEDYFLKKCNDYGISNTDITIFIGSSAELPGTFTNSKSLLPFRLFSVDGGHTRDLTFNDLSLAAINLVSGGIIILDDVSNFDAWPGVIDGMFTWFALIGEDFGPFFVGHNKVFIAHKDYHGIFYEALLNHPFWSIYMSANPFSNNNPNKDSRSGLNSYSWGGYKYLKLISTPSNELIHKEWEAEVLP